MLKLLLFTSDTCPDCKIMKNLLSDLKSKIKFDLMEINISVDLTTALQYQVATVPTLIMIEFIDKPQMDIWDYKKPLNFNMVQHELSSGNIINKNYLIDRIIGCN